MITTAFSIYTITKAVEGESAETETETQSDDQNNDGEKQLTNEEIDKIISDLKATGNIDNILEKLDEIIQRAKLTGNLALQDYATNMKTYYELQKELESVKSLIEASKKKNSDISAVDKQVSEILSSSMIIEDLRGALSTEALLILESLSDENLKALKDLMVEIEGLIDIHNIEMLSVQQRSLLDVLVLHKVIDEGMVSEERLPDAKEALSVAVTILESYEKENYGSSEYEKLVIDSEKFAKSGKKTSIVLPEQVIFLGGHFNLKHAPIMYDGDILIAVDDLFQYIDAKIEYMYNNATIVIQSPNKILEIVSGQNVAYVNDKPRNLQVPILNFNDTIYMSAEFFAEAYDISFRYIEDHECFVFYKNLVQLENPAVPNELNKD